MQIGVLGNQPGEDGVVGADRVDLTLLQRNQAVGPRHHPDDDRWRGDLLDPVSDVVPFDRAHPLARQVGRLRDRRVARARIRWLAFRYTVEKLTSFLRSQVMVMVLTTTSTWLFCSAAMRSADDRMRYSTCDGLPKMSRAISPAMSTSKPVISPVIGSRKLNRLLPMSRPTISLPRLRMLATAASASALL